MIINLIEGLQEEMNRCRDVLKMYEEILPQSVFVAIMIAIASGENAIASGDTIEMMKAYKELREIE